MNGEPQNGRYIINEQTLAPALEDLREKSRLIDALVETYGTPPAWRREPGFASLIYAILEQQVSLASAKAVYQRLLEVTGGLTPASLLSLTDTGLRDIGFSRQKTEYCRLLARAVGSGALDLDSLTGADDDSVRGALVSHKGIGTWTADVYLLHSLGRPDVWPVGDLALRIAVAEKLALDPRPTESEMYVLGEAFVPWRSVAALVFWNGYLTRRGIVAVS